MTRNSMGNHETLDNAIAWYVPQHSLHPDRSDRDFQVYSIAVNNCLYDFSCSAYACLYMCTQYQYSLYGPEETCFSTLESTYQTMSQLFAVASRSRWLFGFRF